MTTVWMYGGGRQSIRIATLILEHKLPCPDIICIADTGREKQSTWDYLERYVQPAFNLYHDCRVIHRVSKEEFATVDIWGGAGKDSLLIPAFSNINGGISKLSPFCSNEWKARVCDRWLKKKMGIKKFTPWLGFSVDEPKRWKPKGGGDYYFPLVHGFSQTKQECVEGVEAFGWPRPVHSACWMCPNQTDNEWLDNSPSDQAKAIQFDKEIRLIDPNAFVHKSCVPLSEVVFVRTNKPKEVCDSGLCML